MTLRLEHLGKQIDAETSIEVPALDVDANSVTSVVGRPDAGSSTLLRLIGGLETPTRGTVTLDGQALGASGPVDRSMVYLVLPGMAHLLPRIGIADPPPPLLLVDGVALGAGRGLPGAEEEDAGWDQIRQELGRIRALGVAVVYATSDPDLALEISDQVAVLEAGKLVQAASPPQLSEHPQTMFVATMFGDPPMNIARAILEKDGCAVQIGPRSLQLSGEIAEIFCRDVYVGVRPDRLRLRCDPPTGWPGQVVGAQVHAGHAYVEVAVDGARFLVLDERAENPAPGARVGLTLHPSDLHVFDDRGDRLEVR